MLRSSNAKAYLALATTVVLWSAAFPAIRAALEGYSAADLTGLRIPAAALILVGVLALRRSPAPQRAHVLRIALSGIVGLALYQWLLATGERRLDAGTAVLLINLSPIFTALGARRWLGERLTRAGWVGIAIAFCGAAFVAFGAGDSGQSTSTIAPAVVAVLLAAMAQATFFLMQKPLLRHYGGLRLTTYSMVAAGAASLPLLVPAGSEVPHASAKATVAVALLAIGSSAIGFTTWAYANSKLDVSVAATSLYSGPAVTILISWLWLGELPSVVTVIGGCVALSGVIVINTRGRRLSGDV